MSGSQEKFLQAVKETICELDGHKYAGGDVKTEHIPEYETTCFIFKCARCEKYVTYAINDRDLCHTYPIEMEFEFDTRSK